MMMIEASMVRMCLASDDAKRMRRLVRGDVLGSYGDAAHKRSSSSCLSYLPSDGEVATTFRGSNSIVVVVAEHGQASRSGGRRSRRAQRDSLVEESGADKNAMAPLIDQVLKIKAKLGPEVATPQEEKKQRINSEISSNPSKGKSRNKSKRTTTRCCRLTASRLGVKSSPSGTSTSCE